jgi:hypothetical protein
MFDPMADDKGKREELAAQKLYDLEQERREQSTRAFEEYVRTHPRYVPVDWARGAWVDTGTGYTTTGYTTTTGSTTTTYYPSTYYHTRGWQEGNSNGDV